MDYADQAWKAVITDRQNMMPLSIGSQKPKSDQHLLRVQIVRDLDIPFVVAADRSLFVVEQVKPCHGKSWEVTKRRVPGGTRQRPNAAHIPERVKHSFRCKITGARRPSGRRLVLAAANLDGFLQTGPTERARLQEAIAEFGGDTLAGLFAPSAGRLLVPMREMNRHRITPLVCGKLPVVGDHDHHDHHQHHEQWQREHESDAKIARAANRVDRAHERCDDSVSAAGRLMIAIINTAGRLLTSDDTSVEERDRERAKAARRDEKATESGVVPAVLAAGSSS